ncbi:MAG TPA: carboxymuconolactone decarboxylase family protein [Vitreimonas sp.]|uniref:carboxymuconolactone decarboxylase family protein n=1 Tax=Vitreimonas sp. TaxID=3069702 RepID=UPI002D61A478|nr:carboxymuconolactone decarboxylase family protein [Vitreimonas sp.]HYD89301.1 carboxymuconolactone decarboxylase family protein [Vitreimonas sp.]
MPKNLRTEDLPGAAGRVAQERPDLWAALQALGEAAGDAGPLDAKTRRLVNLALAIGADSEGATHSHTRRGLADGLTADELHHVAYLAITTLGWPHAIRALTWIQDYTRPNA